MVKALVFATLAAVAVGTPTQCVIPAAYTTVQGTGCGGPATGYNVFGFCKGGTDVNAFTLAAATDEARVQLTTNNGNIFTGANAGAAQGCVVPGSFAQDWDGANTGAALNAATQCNAGNAKAAGAGIFGVTVDSFIKGVEVWCATDYFPVVGYEGSNTCFDQAGMTIVGGQVIWPAANSANPNAYWASGLFDGLNTGAGNGDAQKLAAHVPNFGGTGALQCATYCAILDTICTGGSWLPGIAGGGSGLDLANCRLRPAHADYPTGFNFYCRTGQTFSTQWAATCAAPAGGVTSNFATSPNYAGECGTGEGAQTTPLHNSDGSLNGLPLTVGGTATQEPNQVNGFDAAESILSNKYPVTSGAYATADTARRNWNNNPFQQLVNGFVYDIAVSGCATQTGNTRINCVQRTLNWWRCKYDIPFKGGAICYSNNAVIACPTHELGFRCDSSSKKGLLGLLGLLGLVPLLLICCCLLLLCCIRRKKTEADVHFATFDPLGAPVQPTATAVPTAFAATPFCNAPSAVPVL